MDNEKQLPVKKDLYKKSNFLISAKWKSSLLENKIMAYSLSRVGEIEQDQKTGILYSNIRAAELRKILGGNEGSFYKQLNDVAKILTGRVIGMTNPEEKTFEYISVVSHAIYRDGVFSIGWNPLIKNLIANLENNFTLLNLNLMVSFKNVWSFRLYEILRSKAYNRKDEKSDNNLFEVNYSLSELKFEIGVADVNCNGAKVILDQKVVTPADYDRALEIAEKAGKASYENWKDFKRKVLDVAVNEINESEISEMEINYELNRGGRGGKVKGVTFWVEIPRKVKSDENKKEETDITVISEDDVFDEAWEFLSGDFKSKEVRSFIKEANMDISRIRKAFKVLKAQTKDIDNKVGFMLAAIKNDYEPPRSEKGHKKYKNSFNDFEQREYDFDELEKTLRAN